VDVVVERDDSSMTFDAEHLSATIVVVAAVVDPTMTQLLTPRVNMSWYR
jgi:hypothetical protein